MKLFQPVHRLSASKMLIALCSFIVVFVYLAAQSIPSVSALSAEQKKIFQSGINNFDFAVPCDSGDSEADASADTAATASAGTMYDSLAPDKIPSDAKVVASYVGGSNTYQEAKRRFPDAAVISINETNGNNDPADIWGIEERSGRTAQSTANAIANGLVHGAYGAQSDLDTVKNILNSKGVPRSSYVLWLWAAGTEGDSSIPAGDDAHQYKIEPGGAAYDVSSISSTFVSTIQGTPATAAAATASGSSSDSSGTCCGTSPTVPVTGGTPTSLIGDNNVQKSFNYFIQAGFTPAQSAGIVGNLMQESGGGTTVDPSQTYGIAGFLVAEKSMSAMSKWVTNQGEDPSSLKGQLDFLLWFITKSDSSIGNQIKADKTVEQATIDFQNEFEKCGSPADDQCAQDKRVKYANDVLNGKYGKASVGSGSASGVDISDVVSHYNLQSAIIQKVGNGSNVIASYNPDKPPTTPASTMKLIIADTALQSGLNLDKTVHVTPDVYYDGKNDLGKSSLTLRETLMLMLSQSSNVGANVLMKAMGGVSTFTNKAHSYGYTNTEVKGYYDPSNDGKNSSTIGDEAAAMNHIFSRDGTDYETAQDALKQAAQGGNNYYSVNDIANKWAGTTQVAGNVGLFNINGNMYIIGLYYNGDGINDQTAKNAIKNGSSDLVNKVSSMGSDSTDSGGSCCPASTGSDPTTLSGNDNEEKVFNFFVNTMHYTPEQAAGAVGSLDFESGGMNPTIPNGGGSGAYGIAQWLNSPPGSPTGRLTDLKNFAGSNYNTLEGQVSFMQHELKTDYASVNGQMKNAKSYQDAQKIWTFYYEGLSESPSQWFFEQRNKNALAALNSYGGGASAVSGATAVSGDGESGASCSGSAAADGTVQAAVQAAQQLSSYKVPYIWGGMHGPSLDITDPDKLRSHGMDCSSSSSWVLHQAGMLGSTADDSTALESWGQAGKGSEMTVWANADHAFIEFNVPGLGHYQLNTSGGPRGDGPEFFPWGGPGESDATSGSFTPRHWPGT
jgi:hypothetical protein